MDFLTKNDYAYQNLKADILNGVIQPGSRLISSAIAERYGISTIPVREAINRLTQEGLVVLVPHVGAHVKEFNFDEMMDTLVMIFPLCKLALLLSSAQNTPEQIAEMTRLRRSIEFRVDREGTRVLYERHSVFHLKVFSAHNNKVLIDTLAKNLPSIQQIFNLPYYSEAQWAIAQAEHDGLISALENHDSDKAIAILRNHYYTGAMRFLNHVNAVLWDRSGTQRTYYLKSLPYPELAQDSQAFMDYYRDKIDILLYT